MVINIDKKVFFHYSVFTLFLTYNIRPHRLMVRTPGFHPGNPGSIPGGVTTKPPTKVGGFVFI